MILSKAIDFGKRRTLVDSLGFSIHTNKNWIGPTRKRNVTAGTLRDRRRHVRQHYKRALFMSRYRDTCYDIGYDGHDRLTGTTRPNVGAIHDGGIRSRRNAREIATLCDASGDLKSRSTLNYYARARIPYIVSVRCTRTTT